LSQAPGWSRAVSTQRLSQVTAASQQVAQVVQRQQVVVLGLTGAPAQLLGNPFSP